MSPTYDNGRVIAIGDRVRVKLNVFDLLGKIGDVTAFPFGGYVRIDFDAKHYAHLDAEDIERLGFEDETGRMCRLPGCGKPNDIGAKTCWSCGNAL